ncbi:MAG: 5-formyltetrahydrofolate cyclo-ligase [Rhodospirillaceae bacterium]|nr:5-formyltetrahydrofolate cyclo-ligase [Rhodospirillaceae bacterium]
MTEPLLTPEAKTWRNEQRARLVALRLSYSEEARTAWAARIMQRLEAVAMAAEGPVSVYWPYRGEPDLRLLMRRLAAAGKEVALPAVVRPRWPLEFRPWKPRCEMELGVWNIPIPRTKERLTPVLLLAPVIGFDAHGYRLGYGGGFYDRTLAALTGPRQAIGIGFDCAEMPSIGPHGHDIPMDRIVTESGFRNLHRPLASETQEEASAACAVSEAPESYMGYLTEAEVAGQLKALRTLAGVRDQALTASFDAMLQRLPMHLVAAAEPAQLPADLSIAAAIAALRPRLRNDELHEDLGEILAELEETGAPARRSTTR